MVGKIMKREMILKHFEQYTLTKLVISKREKSTNLKKLAYLAKSWKKFAYLTEFGPKPPVPGSRKKAGWPEAWADWGNLRNPKNPKIQNPKMEEVGTGQFAKS